jgi:BMFP domain-containing protein YqiC
MKNFDFLNDMAKKLCDALPPGLQTMKKDMEKNFHVVLQNTFSKLDLITREEFDAQTKVLSRTRKKVEALEVELKKLEHLFKDKS